MAINQTGKDNSVAEEASAAWERTKGAVKEGVGAVTGDRSLEREGDRQNAEGNARQEANDVMAESTYDRKGSGWLTGSFADRASAESAYNSLTSRGYSKDDVNLLMSKDTREQHFADGTDTELGSKALEGAGVGSAIGGTAGALIAAVLAAGTIAIPGIGIIVAGPLAAALAGAGAGGLTGGIIGALVGAGIPEDRAAEYDADIKNGRIVMGVKPRSEDDASYFENQWRNSKGERVYR